MPHLIRLLHYEDGYDPPHISLFSADSKLSEEISTDILLLEWTNTVSHGTLLK
jgi:hypothetical protein